MKEVLDGALMAGNPVLVATASRAGMPDLAFKGSVMVWDEDHLAFWERAHGTTLQNMRENPQASLLYRNAQSRQAWKFFGTLELHDQGESRDAVMARTIPIELERDPERKGVAVIMRVDRVVQLGKVIMERSVGG
jgi:hypothetical protein